MNIALFGYGKMGKAIEKLAVAAGHEICLIVTASTDLSDINIKALAVDVAIEFSTPAAAYKNIRFCLENNIPVLSGTTGWLDKLSRIKDLVLAKNGAFFYASNFSLGVNLFFKLNRELATLLAKYDYAVTIEETHHIHKKDAPSGTAITLAEDIIKSTPTLKKWVTDSRAEGGGGLPILSIREGEVPGTHKITYRNNNEEISVEHKAKNRQGFALGAIAVAEWIIGKTGILAMDDFLEG